MLANSADRLREALTRMHVMGRSSIMEEYHKPSRHNEATAIPLGAPISHRALRTTDGIVELLKLLAGNARSQYAGLGAPDGPPARPRRGRQLVPSPVSSLDIQARLTDIAARYFNQPGLWFRLADIALTCGSDWIDEVDHPTFSQDAESLIQARRCADHVMQHLLKFRFPDRTSLLASFTTPHPMARPEADEVPEDPFAAVRRLRTVGRLLLAVGDRGYISAEMGAVGTGVGRRGMSDPAAFAVTSCASIWIANSKSRIEGREPKTGTFSRFVEEFLAEAIPIFPHAKLRTALRTFHDTRDIEIRTIAGKLGKDSALFLSAKPNQRRSSG
jgi:hypothetical protein